MTRLPEPTVRLTARQGVLLEPCPVLDYVPGYRPYSYAPVARAGQVPRPVLVLRADAVVPAGMVDAATAARVLGWPVALVLRKAQTNPHQLPPHFVVDGQPYFRPADLPPQPS